MSNDDKPSIAELQRLADLQPGPCDTCNGEGRCDFVGPISGEWSERCEDCDGTGNALTVAMRSLHAVAPALLEIAAAALEHLRVLDAPMSGHCYVEASRSALRAALAKVRP